MKIIIYIIIFICALILTCTVLNSEEVKPLKIDNATNNTDQKLNVASYYENIFNWRKAQIEYENVLKKSPDSKEAILGYSRVLIHLGDTNKSKLILENLNKSKPDYLPGYLSLIGLYSITGETDREKTLYNTLKAYGMMDSSIEAEQLELEEKYEEAERILVKETDNAPTKVKAYCLTNKGRFYERRNRFTEALREYYNSIELVNKGHLGDILDSKLHVGLCHMALGENNKAEEYFKDIINTYRAEVIGNGSLDDMQAYNTVLLQSYLISRIDKGINDNSELVRRLTQLTGIDFDNSIDYSSKLLLLYADKTELPKINEYMMSCKTTAPYSRGSLWGSYYLKLWNIINTKEGSSNNDARDMLRKGIIEILKHRNT